MSKDDITVTLYKAHWCKHCSNFLPEWEKLEQKCSDYGIKAVKFDADDDKNEVNEADVQGFPTIRIKRGNSVEDYNGERSADAILNHINKLKNGNKPNLRGGGNDDIYHRYRKYKSKYLHLKYKKQ